MTGLTASPYFVKPSVGGQNHRTGGKADVLHVANQNSILDANTIPWALPGVRSELRIKNKP